jgi:ATP-binding cassette subfamily F protein 3
MSFNSLLQLNNGVKSFGTKILFDSAQFTVNEGEHVGIIGPNGAGKTTLFKILAGEDSLDDGSITKSNSLRLGYLPQHDLWGPEQTVESYLEEGCQMPLWELKALGRGLGLNEVLFSQPIQSLSGGYRMRCKLLYLIGQQPNLMLLDEPTNYLDLETTLVLEKFLQGYSGAFLLVSHDREFLRRTTDHILEIEQGEIIKFNGNLDDYFEQKELLRTQLEAQALSQQAKKDEILKFVARFGAKATKARQAQSKLKLLDKMETIELKPIAMKAAIKIPPPQKTGKIILQMNRVDLGYGEKTVLRNIDYILKNGDHVAIVGLNGAGKSTFLKAMAQVLPPQKGQVELGHNVSIGYYAQHVAESLNNSKDILHQLTVSAHPDLTPQDVLNMAGSLLFSGDDVKKKIAVLSGGERSRVALGRILLQRAPFLVLDEPTNHLDFQTVEALTQALTKYDGALAVVSHDRSFIRRVGTKIVEINNGEVTLYHGSYDDYVWSLQNGALAQRKSTIKEPTHVLAPQIKDQQKFNFKEAKKAIEKELKTCGRSILQIEKTLTELEEKLPQLNLAITSAQNGSAKDLIEEMGVVQKEIENLEKQWLEIQARKDILERDLNNLNKS